MPVGGCSQWLVTSGTCRGVVSKTKDVRVLVHGLCRSFGFTLRSFKLGHNIIDNYCIAVRVFCGDQIIDE